MSIIPASRLSSSDLARLGNNLSFPSRRSSTRASQARRQLAAVNRSLSIVGERVGRLYRGKLATA
jgi:hypothetical protein